MQKTAVHYLSLEEARDRLKATPETHWYQYVQTIYRALPANMSMSIRHFNQLASEFAPTFKPTALDNRIAVTEHAARPDTRDAVRQAQSQAHVDFLEKMEYISNSELDDVTRKELNKIISKVTMDYTK